MNSNMLPTNIPSPNGWTLSVAGSYASDSILSVSLSNTSPSKRYRGLLLWATNPSGVQVGSWTLPLDYKVPSGCSAASLSHSSGSSKSQRSFSFTPPAPGGGSLTFQAVVNEECGAASCRASHAFTDSVSTTETTFALTVSRNGDGVGTLTQSASGINCGTACTASIAANQNLTLLASAARNAVLTAWTGCDSVATDQCTITMTGPRAVSATFMEAQLDVDDSGAPTRYDAATDGVLVVRYLFGLRGSALVDNAVAPSVTTRSAANIVSYLDARLASMDVDGDGSVLATTDGLMMLRYMLNLRDAALVSGARRGSLTDAQIQARIAALMPKPLP